MPTSDSTKTKPVAVSLDDAGRRSALRWLEFLELFEDVPAEDLGILLEDVSMVRLDRGQLLLDGDGSGGAVFILRSGSALASFTGPHGEMADMAPLEPGDMVGGLSALTRTSFGLTVQAMRDTVVYRVGEAAFLRFLDNSHKGALRVMRHLSRWLVQSMNPVQRPRESNNIALVAVAEGIDLDSIGDTITRYLADRQLAVELITPSSAPDSSEVVCAIEAVNDVVVMTTSAADPKWLERAVANADRVVLVDAPGHPARPEPDLLRICGQGRRPLLDLLVLHDAATEYPGLAARWQAREDLDERMNIRQGSAADLEFVARMLVGRAVGLVLAGGGARGYVHLGVARALREAGIPIDMVAGTSMGGIVAAGIGYMWSIERMSSALGDMFAKNSPVGDYTLPLVSLVRGYRVSRRLRDTFGDLSLDNMWRPFFCVSSNLSNGSPFVHRTGPAWEALRATSALPGILPPMVLNRQVLVDGAIMNNFPVDIMRRMGRGVVIGSNIKVDEQFLSTLTNIEDLGAWGLAKRIRNQPVNIFSIMSRTATISSLKQTRYCCSIADLLIEAPADDVGLLDWKALHKLSDRAYRHTCDLIERNGITYDTLIKGTTTASPPGGADPAASALAEALT